jgi:PTS system ascorbate-specific IIA component
MIGILIIAHGTLGDSLIHCASHVFGGQQARLLQFGVAVHDDPVALLPQVRKLVGELDDGSGVLILTDIYGATPSNLACRLVEPGRVDCVAGVNLPMLVRAITYRNDPLAAVAEKALSGGREGVVHVTLEACDVTTKYSHH